MLEQTQIPETSEDELTWIQKKTAQFISLIGAIGVGFQGYAAMLDFIQNVILGQKTVSAIAHGVSAVIGGVTSTITNFYINLDLLVALLTRAFSKKKAIELDFWQKIRYWLGALVFLVTGLLFGLTALTIAMSTPFAVLAIIAGIFVSIIMVIQELETWFESFDETEELKSLSDIVKAWYNSLTPAKIFGHVVAAGNVIALSLLFTVGLAGFLMMINVAALPAFIVGLTVAFTFGAFTEFYFYNASLSKFCKEFIERYWIPIKDKIQSGLMPKLGFGCVVTNAVINGVLTYVGVQMLTGLLEAASMGLPAMGVMVALGIFSAVFAASASFLLGLKFFVGPQPEVNLRTEKNHDVVTHAHEHQITGPKHFASPMAAQLQKIDFREESKSQPYITIERFA